MADRVQRALNADQVLYARHITVRADGGVVTLERLCLDSGGTRRGEAGSPQAVPGVAKVVDRMEVDRGALSDSAVTR